MNNETSLNQAAVKMTKGTYLIECRISRDKSQSSSICKCKDNLHLVLMMRWEII